VDAFIFLIRKIFHLIAKYFKNKDDKYDIFNKSSERESQGKFNH
jgi:hypothetical protein